MPTCLASSIPWASTKPSRSGPASRRVRCSAAWSSYRRAAFGSTRQPAWKNAVSGSPATQSGSGVVFPAQSKRPRSRCWKPCSGPPTCACCGLMCPWAATFLAGSTARSSRPSAYAPRANGFALFRCASRTPSTTKPVFSGRCRAFWAATTQRSSYRSGTLRKCFPR